MSRSDWIAPLWLVAAVGLCGCASDRSANVASPSKPRSEANATRTVSPDAPEDLSALLAAALARTKIPGVAALVLRGDRVIAQGVAGVRKLGAAEPVTIEDEFEICSCAKAMTATLVASFVDEGRLSWDTSLAEIFGDSVSHLDPAWRKVTVRQVLEHRAGLDDHLVLLARTVLFSHGDPTALRRVLAAKILARPPDFPPGQKFFYESAGYVIIGAALEKISGRPWDELMRARLFEPLGLASAGFGPPGTPGKLDQPWGHGPHWLFYFPLPGASGVPFDPGSPHADFPAVGAPAGLVHVALGDWAKFVALHLRGDPANPHRAVTLLKPETFAELHGVGADGEYAGGWFTGRRPWAKGARPGDTGCVFFHQGDNTRWNCVVWVAPEIDFAILIASNRTAMWQPLDEIAGKLVASYARPAAAEEPGKSARSDAR
ncbi:MAG TPA: serine hydrolase domain-containing protein [Opitutaceae bacterium]|nr:serine hydrolase domain-containing protein [Opitutaceae bacterium]